MDPVRDKNYSDFAGSQANRSSNGVDADSLKNLVRQLLDSLGVSAYEVSVSSGGRTVVAIKTAEAKDLIGPGGEHLRALNTIAHRLAETRDGKETTNFLIDVNGHHEAELEGVRASARTLAQRARLFKHDVELGPMSSYERLVVHELFADDPEIKTESAGEGKFRHIVLKYRVA